MKSYIIERAQKEGKYIVETGDTVRATGEKYGISKST
ncbi:MAG: sporulation transcriptional regulator SpoIIID, partial [Clostridiales bacterium]|nr:sporulation transcriptional regulator SpoIIID [Clostridiales bacterium]